MYFGKSIDAIDGKYCKHCKKYISSEPPVTHVLPDKDFHRFRHEPGSGLLGYCIPSLGTIGLRSDLYGVDFEKVLDHERMHDAGINDEYLIRVITEWRYPDAKY